MKKKIIKVLAILAAFFIVFQILLNVSAGNWGTDPIKAVGAATDEENNDVNENADSIKILEAITAKESYDVNEQVEFIVTTSMSARRVTILTEDGKSRFNGYQSVVVDNTRVFTLNRSFDSELSAKLTVIAYDFYGNADYSEINLEVKKPGSLEPEPSEPDPSEPEQPESEPLEIFSIRLYPIEYNKILVGNPIEITVSTSTNVENVFWYLKDQQITSAPMEFSYERDGKKFFSLTETFHSFSDSLYFIAKDKDGREVEEFYGDLNTSYISNINRSGYSYIGTYTTIDVWTVGIVGSVVVYDSEDNEVYRTSDARQTFRYSLHIPVTEPGSKTYKIVANYTQYSKSIYGEGDERYITINAVEPDWNAVRPFMEQIPFILTYCKVDTNKDYRLNDVLPLNYTIIGKIDNIVVLDSFGNEIISTTDVPMPVDYTNYLYTAIYYETIGTLEIDLLSLGEQKYTIIFTDVNGEVLKEEIDVTVLPVNGNT